MKVLERPPDARPLAHGAGADTELLARVVAERAGAELLVGAAIAECNGQRPQHGPGGSARRAELAQAAVGVASAQEDERGG